MDYSVIKFMLENKKPKAYSLIVQMYFDKIEMHKASVFKIWLAKELEISPDLIHETSISTALSRYKKRMAKSPSSFSTAPIADKPSLDYSSDFNTDIPEIFPGFK